jgi:hypothetical protein
MDPLLRATLVAMYGEENVAKLEAAPTPAELTVIQDEAEAARFAAEIARDAAAGDATNWPHE